MVEFLSSLHIQLYLHGHFVVDDVPYKLLHILQLPAGM